MLSHNEKAATCQDIYPALKNLIHCSITKTFKTENERRRRCMSKYLIMLSKILIHCSKTKTLKTENEKEENGDGDDHQNPVRRATILDLDQGGSNPNSDPESQPGRASNSVVGGEKASVSFEFSIQTFVGSKRMKIVQSLAQSF